MGGGGDECGCGCGGGCGGACGRGCGGADDAPPPPPDARVHFAAFPEPNGIRFGQNRIPFGSAECLTLSVLCIQTMLSALELVRYLY